MPVILTVGCDKNAIESRASGKKSTDFRELQAARGFSQRTSVNRAKSVSAETTVSPCSTASASTGLDPGRTGRAPRASRPRS
jgi:hypothetical protein